MGSFNNIFFYFPETSTILLQAKIKLKSLRKFTKNIFRKKTIKKIKKFIRYVTIYTFRCLKFLKLYLQSRQFKSLLKNIFSCQTLKCIFLNYFVFFFFFGVFLSLLVSKNSISIKLTNNLKIEPTLPNLLKSNKKNEKEHQIIDPFELEKENDKLYPKVSMVNLEPIETYKEGKKYTNDEGIFDVLVLEGTYYEMGEQYGHLMKTKLLSTFEILNDFFIKKHKVDYIRLIQKSEKFWERYKIEKYRNFIRGISKSSEISLDKIKIILSMETLLGVLTEKKNEDKTTLNSTFGCSFGFIPSNDSPDESIISRFYDFFPPFNKIAKYLTVTILKENLEEEEEEESKVPTAIIGLPGQIYCPSCINKNGIFLELNNGFASGGGKIGDVKNSILIKLLDILQNSENFDDVPEQLMDPKMKTDFSLIINFANHTNMGSIEFSTKLDKKKISLQDFNDPPFAVTNFFLNDTWNWGKDVPLPSDKKTWLGVTRRNNLLNLFENLSENSIETILKIMDNKIQNGGAMWDATIYQIVFHPKSMSLFLRTPFPINKEYKEMWTQISLDLLFR